MMNTKTNLTLAIVSLLALAHFFNEKRSDRTNYTKASLSFIKCTPAQFMLGDIDTTKQISPLFNNLGNLHFSITTKNKRAQAFFDQGIKLSYAFNHAEAHRSFMEAARLDPESAMAYWGQAYALGPNINDPLPLEDRKNKINEALSMAHGLVSGASRKEQALIEALSARYSTDLNKDPDLLDMAYFKKMEKVVEQFPDDAHIQILFAQSAMNTVRWNYWDKEGNPSPNIKAAKEALEKAMKLEPENPGGHHYYIHMVELPYPDKGVKSADKLASLMPGAGHIVHMPSHIYIRVGRYLDAVKTNQLAIAADEDYISQCFAQGLYPLAYYPHNIHFLWSSASLLGASEIAIDAAKKTAEKVPVGELKDLPFLQDFAATPLLAYTRFGKWNEILTIPAPNAEIKHLNLIRHYARGIAFIKKGNITKAQEELKAIAVLKEDPALESIVATANNASVHAANIAYEVVSGELEAFQGNYTRAIEHLEKAVRFEDGLTYTEPAAWHIPTRQNLGAVLLKAEQYEKAEKVYTEDLNILRQNGWSLMGLYQSLRLQGKKEEALTIKTEFDKAWEHADVKIETSVL
ncbi:tetratricopeptide repeat protein [Zobellia uliginosa]|uniref:tetratricopeptide repeat protein n=1 Tax=Zobellia uliginosa TaxID=143224 RepID=UPI0026E1E85A|nr:tetratricopeptide repeat protein [Zobellia uliginosa]MDO6518218.1 tetratricopeptide repeat protein [Zobellia uliginosa]